LPIVPSRTCASIVAARRPEYSSLIEKAYPHWVRLRELGADVRQLAKSDVEVLEDLLPEASREFENLSSAGLIREAKVVSNVMTFVEKVKSEMGGYPGLDELVAESARRVVAFVEHAEAEVDFLSAGGIQVTFREPRYGVPQRRLLQLVRRSDRSSGDKPTAVSGSRDHPFLADVQQRLRMRGDGKTNGFDFETGEACFTARGGRELGFLLADLCKADEKKLMVKAFNFNYYHGRGIDLASTLGNSRRMTTVAAVTLGAGTLPSDALIGFLDAASWSDFPSSESLFFVTEAREYTHVQEFIVWQGSILLSYAPGDPDPGKSDCRRLAAQVTPTPGADHIGVDRPLDGVSVVDRRLATLMARRARTHAGSRWGKIAHLHRVRIGVTTERGAVLVSLHLAGMEPYFGVPYARILREVKKKRARYISTLCNDPLLLKHLDCNYRCGSGGNYLRPTQDDCLAAARTILSAPPETRELTFADAHRHFTFAMARAINAGRRPKAELDPEPFEFDMGEFSPDFAPLLED
jgi:hypothetical protein